MQYIEALQQYYKRGEEISIFLAGGITGCYDWQKDLVQMLSNTNLVILNPRRRNFPIHDPNASYEQIKWEYEHMQKADIISFWFPHETLCPIVLFELGSWSMTEKRLTIGIHPEYKRKQDIEIQMKLRQPYIIISYSLLDLAQRIAYMTGEHFPL